jgi:hypothetical protein
MALSTTVPISAWRFIAVLDAAVCSARFSASPIGGAGTLLVLGADDLFISNGVVVLVVVVIMPFSEESMSAAKIGVQICDCFAGMGSRAAAAATKATSFGVSAVD